MIETQVFDTTKRLFLMTIGAGPATHLTLGNDETLCGREGQYGELRGDFCTRCYRTATRFETEFPIPSEEAPAVAESATITENTNTDKGADMDTTMVKVQRGNGKIHDARKIGDYMATPVCGGNRSAEGYREVSGEANCAKCLKIAAVGHQAPEFDTLNPVSNTNQEETDTMAETTTPAKLDVTTDDGKAALEQINANIERVRSLAEAENVDAVKELTDETETIISALTGKGNIKAKKDSREALKAAGLVQDKPKGKEVAKPAAEGTVMEKTWDQYEGTVELVTMGAEKVAEGVRLHSKTAAVAKDAAAVIFDVWTRIPNKAGIPDLVGDSDAAKKASKALYAEAGKGFEENFDNKKSLAALIRSVQDQRSDVRAEWLRSLDGDDDVAAERRALMAPVLEGKPEDEKASEWVANVYGVSTIGNTEKRRLEYQAKKAAELTGGNGGSGEGEGEGDGDGDDETTEPTTAVDPDEYMTKTVDRLFKDVEKTDRDKFEKASEEAKKANLARLEAISKAVKEMIAAAL